MFCAYRPTDMTKRITKPPCRQQRDRPPSIISNFSFFKQDRIINSHHNTVSIYCTCFPTGNTPNQPSNRDDDATCALVLFAWFSSENFVSLSGLLRLLCDLRLRVVRGDCVVSVDLRFCPHFHTLCQQSAGNATDHTSYTRWDNNERHTFSVISHKTEEFRMLLVHTRRGLWWVLCAIGMRRPEHYVGLHSFDCIKRSSSLALYEHRTTHRFIAPPLKGTHSNHHI